MIPLVKTNILKKTLLIRCIVASILVHLTFLYFFYRHPIEIFSKNFFLKSKPLPTEILAEDNIEGYQKDQYLAEVFDEILFIGNTGSTPYDSKDLALTTALSPTFEKTQTSLLFENDLDAMKLSFKEDIENVEINDKYKLQEVVFDKTIQKSLDISVSEENELTINFPNSPINFLPEISFIDTSKAEIFEYELPTDKKYNNNLSIEEKAYADTLPLEPREIPNLKAPVDNIRIPTNQQEWAKKNITFDSSEIKDPLIETKEELFPYISSLNTLIDEDSLYKMSNIVSWNDSFDVAVSISPPTEEGKYIFSLTIVPKQNMTYEKLAQNFYYLIDSSSKVDKQKFGTFKRGILKSLSSLQQGDRFNIIVLDKQLSRLSNKNLIFNTKSLQLAEEFLEKVSQNTILTSVDLMESLDKLTVLIPEDNQMHTGLLLTNGVLSQGFKNQQKAIKKFVASNANKITIYAAAVGGKNNLVNLDMLCNLTGGKILYSDTNASFPRKFASLIKSLSAPIAKNIKVSAQAKNPKAGLDIASSTQQLPAFFANEPYKIIGNIERLSDIEILIEAKHDDEWVTIQKKISFQDAKVDKQLIDLWNNSQIKSEYKNFLSDPKAKNLKKAKELLDQNYGKAATE